MKNTQTTLKIHQDLDLSSDLVHFLTEVGRAQALSWEGSSQDGRAQAIPSEYASRYIPVVGNYNLRDCHAMNLRPHTNLFWQNHTSWEQCA